MRDRRTNLTLVIDAEPARILVLSARVGGGHVAAARALAARMRVLWPGAQVLEVERTGRGGRYRDRVLEGAYSLAMRRLPWLYGLAYDALVRFPRATAWTRTLVAAVLGRALAPLVAEHQPHLVVSTYPMTSAGLAQLRRRGALPCHAVAVVTDLAVHPFWVWPELDETWTLLPASAQAARAFAPAAVVRVAAAPVASRFTPGDRASARRSLGLRPDALVVLATGGALGIGSLDGLVDAALAAGEGVQVVAVCGRNTGLATVLRRRGLPTERLAVRGFSERMAEEMTAADLVLTTAGGVIALEALAVGRPVLFATPVPGHGVASAATMAEAGLAVHCPRPADVTAELRRLLTDPAALARLARRATDFAATHDLDRDLSALARAVGPPLSPPGWAGPPAPGAVPDTPAGPAR